MTSVWVNLPFEIMSSTRMIRPDAERTIDDTTETTGEIVHSTVEQTVEAFDQGVASFDRAEDKNRRNAR